MDESSVPGRTRRAVRVELNADCLSRVEDEAEERSTTAGLLIAMMVHDRFPAPVEVST